MSSFHQTNSKKQCVARTTSVPTYYGLYPNNALSTTQQNTSLPNCTTSSPTRLGAFLSIPVVDSLGQLNYSCIFSPTDSNLHIGSNLPSGSNLNHLANEFIPFARQQNSEMGEASEGTDVNEVNAFYATQSKCRSSGCPNEGLNSMSEFGRCHGCFRLEYETVKKRAGVDKCFMFLVGQCISANEYIQSNKHILPGEPSYYINNGDIVIRHMCQPCWRKYGDNSKNGIPLHFTYAKSTLNNLLHGRQNMTHEHVVGALVSMVETLNKENEDLKKVLNVVSECNTHAGKRSFDTLRS